MTIHIRTTITAAEVRKLRGAYEGQAFVVVGYNGVEPGIWGAGATYEEAETDAKRWIAESESTWDREETETLEVVD